MSETSRLGAAFALVVDIHGGQKRKGNGVPYLTHLMAVSALVGEFGGDEELMIAGLLHDALEDQPHRIDAAQIAAHFGWRVAYTVIGCSDCNTHPKPPWEERKQAFLKRLAASCVDVRFVAAADKLHNTRSFVSAVRERGDAAWSAYNAPKERQCWYLRGCVDALRCGWEHPIVNELELVVAELERLCGVVR